MSGLTQSQSSNVNKITPLSNMKLEEKIAIVEDLAEKLEKFDHFYIADVTNLNASETTQLRRKCYDRNIKLVVVKNTLLKRALEKSGKNFDEINGVLKAPSSVMFCETANAPGKLIKEFRKKHDRPLLKAAYVEESLYVGDDQLEVLANLKSKEELIGDIVLMLQSPARNVISALESGGGKLAGIVKTLSEKE